ncbi:MAG: MmpS family transport accessory protein [Mycobacterium sp.]
MRLLTRNWMVLVAILVVALTSFGVYKMHGIFGSNFNPKTPGGGADQIVPFNPKHVVLEVFGDPGATATITYMDIDAHPQRVDNAPLPWTYSDTTTTPAVLVNVQAQGDGSSLGCRITIDDVVKSERTVNTPSAFTYCLDKSG